jgi:uncharacterized protein (DUF488 family)
MASVPTAYTVGHSNHTLEHFLQLLNDASIDVVVDVRSFPYSRFAPQFNRDGLAAALVHAGIKYVFMGAELGGRPDGDEFYDESDHILYGRVAESELFQDGLARVEDGLDRFRVALMCSEEDPEGCHRRLLVTRVLGDHGVRVVHLRGDGRAQAEEEVGGRAGSANAQIGLFDEGGDDAWRSIRSVSRRRAPASSSAS